MQQVQIQSGWEVRDLDGDKIGVVSESLGSSILVQKGLIFPKDVYVPMTAVESVADGVVTVNVDKDDIESMGWDRPITEDGGTIQTEAYGREAFRREDTGGRDRDRIRLHEEELLAQKTARETGAVEVTKNVVEEVKTLDVPVTREEVHVRRVPVDETAVASGDAFHEGSVRVPIVEEQVEVRKTPRVTEELQIEKTRAADTQSVSDTVRRETADVREVGDVEIEQRTAG